jgi:uncharacterized membrane protein YccC
MARLAQTVVTLAGMCAAMAAFFWVQPAWLGVALAIALFFSFGFVADRIFRRLATPEQRRADLERRARAD